MFKPITKGQSAVCRISNNSVQEKTGKAAVGGCFSCTSLSSHISLISLLHFPAHAETFERRFCVHSADSIRFTALLIIPPQLRRQAHQAPVRSSPGAPFYSRPHTRTAFRKIHGKSAGRKHHSYFFKTVCPVSPRGLPPPLRKRYGDPPPLPLTPHFCIPLQPVRQK